MDQVNKCDIQERWVTEFLRGPRFGIGGRGGDYAHIGVGRDMGARADISPMASLLLCLGARGACPALGPGYSKMTSHVAGPLPSMLACARMARQAR